MLPRELRKKRAPLSPARKRKLSRDLHKAMAALRKRRTGTAQAAIKYAKDHPGVQVALFRAEPLGVQQFLTSLTGCCGLGPFRWHSNPSGWWFLTFKPLPPDPRDG